jgi:ferric enterobactin receptor
MPTGGAPNGMKMPEGRVFGKVVDEQGKPVEFASVVLLKTVMDNATKQPKDVMVKAQNSELNGDFSFPEVPIMGKLKLKISSVGYKTF